MVLACCAHFVWLCMLPVQDPHTKSKHLPLSILQIHKQQDKRVRVLAKHAAHCLLFVHGCTCFPCRIPKQKASNWPYQSSNCRNSCFIQEKYLQCLQSCRHQSTLNNFHSSMTQRPKDPQDISHIQLNVNANYHSCISRKTW